MNTQSKSNVRTQKALSSIGFSSSFHLIASRETILNVAIAAPGDLVDVTISCIAAACAQGVSSLSWTQLPPNLRHRLKTFHCQHLPCLTAWNAGKACKVFPLSVRQSLTTIVKPDLGTGDLDLSTNNFMESHKGFFACADFKCSMLGMPSSHVSSRELWAVNEGVIDCR
jgi:hypothetical protein